MSKGCKSVGCKEEDGGVIIGNQCWRSVYFRTKSGVVHTSSEICGNGWRLPTDADLCNFRSIKGSLSVDIDNPKKGYPTQVSAKILVLPQAYQTGWENRYPAYVAITEQNDRESFYYCHYTSADKITCENNPFYLGLGKPMVNFGGIHYSPVQRCILLTNTELQVTHYATGSAVVMDPWKHVFPCVKTGN